MRDRLSVASFLIGAPVLLLSLVGLADHAAGEPYPFGTELGFRYRSATHYIGVAVAQAAAAALLLLFGFRGAKGPALVCMAVIACLFLLLP